LFAILALMCVVVGNAQRQRVLDDSVPPAAEAVTLPDSTTIFLLAAFGDSNIATPGLTDVLMLVAVDSAAGSVSMLHVPRDLWVNIPGFGMDKINSAYYLGETHAVEGGGLATLHQTIVYNFGFDFDHYAMMDFTGFLGVIDQLGGVRVAVDCVIRDWKLVDRYADKTVEENYAMFTLPFGVHTLDADTALWYVRSRKTSSDLDRGRRQQDVLRAIWRTVRENGLIENLPTLWDATSRYVVTDLTLADALGYAPLAASLDANAIEQYRFEGGDHFSNALGPAPEYRAVLEPKWEAIHDLVGDFLTPPTPNQSALRGLRVQVVNAGGINGLATVAADRLAQAGLNPEIITEATHYREFTAIYDYTGQTKGSPIAAMQDLFRTTSDGVVVEPDPNRTVDYKIYVGASYRAWACDRPVIQPEWPPAEATPTP
jgi:LCP family protein required for cell wall assembly